MILKMQSFISLKGNTQWALQSLLGPKLRLFSALRFSSKGQILLYQTLNNTVLLDVPMEQLPRGSINTYSYFNSGTAPL